MPEMGQQRYQTDDLTIAAALLTLNGAAWDGRESLTFGVPAEKVGQRRHLLVQVAETRCEKVDRRVTKPWTDTGSGRVYQPGETAPMNRVVFVLDGAYREYRASASVDTSFMADDWARWVREFHRDGGMLRQMKTMEAQENILRNLMRDRHGITSRFRMTVKDGAR